MTALAPSDWKSEYYELAVMHARLVNAFGEMQKARIEEQKRLEIVKDLLEAALTEVSVPLRQIYLMRA